jgi:hypothetical protein
MNQLPPLAIAGRANVRAWWYRTFFGAERPSVTGFSGYFGYFSHHTAVEKIVEAVLQIPIMDSTDQLVGSFPSPMTNLTY